MNKLSKDPIDQYFRETLESPDLKYNKQDWKGLEARLPRKSKAKMIGWLLPLAAILLIFMSLWLFKEPVNEEKRLSKSDTASSVKVDSNNDHTLLTDKRKQMAKDVPSEHSNILSTPSEKRPKSNPFDNFSNTTPVIVPSFSADAGNRDDRHILAGPVALVTTSIPENTAFYMPEITDLNIAPVVAEVKTDISETTVGPKATDRLSLALSISPDMNTVSHFSKSHLGMSIGIGAVYRISPRFSITTAVGYSKKVYSAMPYEYKAPWAGKYAKSIDADCRVLDIPLNLNYSFSNSSKQSFFASAGLSSYFMLKEKYTLIGTSQPGYPNKTDPSYSYKNDNNHLLSVVNLSVGMSRPLNKHTSIVIEPYVKLPYTGIGQGKVNLQSAGINLQLQFNFPRKTKPDFSPSNAAQ